MIFDDIGDDDGRGGTSPYVGMMGFLGGGKHFKRRSSRYFAELELGVPRRGAARMSPVRENGRLEMMNILYVGKKVKILKESS